VSWAIQFQFPDGRIGYEAEDQYELTWSVDDAGLYASRRAVVERLDKYRSTGLAFGIQAVPVDVSEGVD
jgi:hypothetical protein